MSVTTTVSIFDFAAYEEWSHESDDLDDEQFSAEEFSRLVKKVIANELTETEQEVIRLYYYELCTMTEIAKRQGVSRTSVSKSLRRACAKLHTYLKYAAELYFGREM